MMFITLAKWVKYDSSLENAAATVESYRSTSKHENQQRSDEVERLPALTGINIEKGLKVTGGNEKLYHRLLLKFYRSQKDFEKQFRLAEKSKDTTEASRAAHTLKGLAGSIGATYLEKAAAVLEQRFGNQQLSCPLKCSKAL